MSREQSDGPTLVQRRILLLLAAGFTIQTITKLVFLSERAVYEHISTLKNATGAKNQFSLGAEAAKRGWLGEDEQAKGRPPADPRPANPRRPGQPG